MLAFAPESVRHVLAMLEPGPALNAEAARLAALTGSWPELLAHLLLRRGSLDACPEIAEAIRAQAASYGGGPASPRAEGRDLMQMERTATELEDALAAILAAEAEAERLALADRASAAWRAHTGARPGTAFDLHLRMATERR
jgi:hypothetical protein